MALFRKTYCPLNWHIYRSAKVLDRTCTFLGQFFYLSKVDLTKTQKGGEKTWNRSEEKVNRLCFFSFGKGKRRKRTYSNSKDSGKENSVFQQLFIFGAFSFVSSFVPVVKFFSRWTHVEGKRLRHVRFEPATTFSNGKGKKSKWKCWRYAWNWWGVNLRKACHPPPAVTWKVRVLLRGCSVIFQLRSWVSSLLWRNINNN